MIRAEIVVKEVSNTPEMQYKASLRKITPTSIAGVGRYGKTAAEALERLQAAYDCAGLTIRYEPAKLVPITQIYPIKQAPSKDETPVTFTPSYAEIATVAFIVIALFVFGVGLNAVESVAK